MQIESIGYLRPPLKPITATILQPESASFHDLLAVGVIGGIRFPQLLHFRADLDRCQEFVKLLGPFLLPARKNMRVGVQGQREVGMTGWLLHHLGMDSLLEQESRSSVPQVIETDVRQLGLSLENLGVSILHLESL